MMKLLQHVELELLAVGASNLFKLCTIVAEIPIEWLLTEMLERLHITFGDVSRKRFFYTVISPVGESIK